MGSTIRTTTLPGGATVPVLGQGTWNMGEDHSRRADEIAALRLGIDLGMTLIDTAEMYASGGAEELIAETVAGRRDEVFLVSKVFPSNASRAGVARSCEQSLKRLRTDHIELYLLHWRGSVPLAETVEAFETLKQQGKILGWGVSNFDTDDMEELGRVPDGQFVETNQVLYSLASRGIDYDLLPRSIRDSVPVMAYSPVGQGDLANDGRLAGIAARHGATPAQIALAWVLRHDSVIAIPKAASPDHVRDNRAALDLALSDADMNELDRLFPPPSMKLPLEMI